MTLGLMLAIPAVALADNVQNDVVATAGQKIVSVQAGQTSSSVGYQIAATGGDSTDTTGRDGQSCNPAVAPAQLTLSGLPSGVAVKDATGATTLTAPHLTFTTCGTDQFVKFAVGSSVTPGDYTISVSDITNSGFESDDFNENPANFTLRVTAAPSDTAAPTNATIDIDDGAAWTKNTSGTVSLDLSATDNVGVASYKLAETQAGLASATAVPVSPAEASFSRTNVSFTLTGSETSAKAVYLQVCDAQNNCAITSDTIGWDKTAPTITDLGATTSPNAAGWYKTDVINQFKASDGGPSGLNAACVTNFPANQAGDNVQSKTTSGQGTAVNVTSDSCTDVAGNSTAGVTSANFKIDKTPPTVSVTGVSQGGSYTYGDVPTPDCETQDQSGLSGVKTNATVNVTGGNNGFGTFTATCSGAVDNADNNQASPVSATYTVSANFHGWLQPVDGDGSDTGTLNIGKVSRTYPIKWQLKDSSGALLSDTTAQLLVGTMSGGQVKKNCDSFSVSNSDTLEESLTGNTALRYDAISDQFIYNYKAPSTLGCYAFAIKNADGATIKQANFDFRK